MPQLSASKINYERRSAYLIRYFDIFAGIGGFRSGLERAGSFECVGYCEIDKYAKQAYEALYDTSKEVYYDDARKIDTDRMPDFDLICGGISMPAVLRCWPQTWLQ